MSSQAPLADGGLHAPGSYGSVGHYLAGMWERRAYLVHVPRANLDAQNQSTVLGNLWHLLNPALTIAVYYLVFGVLLQTTRGVEYFLPFLATGIFVFQFTQKAITASAKSLRVKKGLIRSISFPRALLPLESTITEALAFLPGLLVVLVLTLVMGAPVRFAWLLLPVLVALQFLFNAGAGWVAARVTHQYPDFLNVLPYIFRLLFYGSGVLFLVDAYVDSGLLRAVFVLNPVYCMLSLFRWAVLGMSAQWTEAASLLGWGVVLVVAGLWWFRRSEATYGA